MSGVLLASNMILWVGIICGYTWVKFLWSISMLHHWTIAFFPILGIFKGLLDHAPSMGTSPSKLNTTQEILIIWLLIPFALFLYRNFLADARREIEKSAQKQDPKNPFPDSITTSTQPTYLFKMYRLFSLKCLFLFRFISGNG